MWLFSLSATLPHPLLPGPITTHFSQAPLLPLPPATTTTFTTATMSKLIFLYFRYHYFSNNKPKGPNDIRVRTSFGPHVSSIYFVLSFLPKHHHRHWHKLTNGPRQRHLGPRFTKTCSPTSQKYIPRPQRMGNTRKCQWGRPKEGEEDSKGRRKLKLSFRSSKAHLTRPGASFVVFMKNK